MQWATAIMIEAKVMLMEQHFIFVISVWDVGVCWLAAREWGKFEFGAYVGQVATGLQKSS